MLRLLTILALSITAASGVSAGITCLDESSNPIDWFVIYKLPKYMLNSSTNSAGYSYYYLDAKQPTWRLSSNTLDKEDQSVGYTLQQVYDDSQNTLHVIYNDEHPDGPKSDTHGHTKGVLSADTSTGFWLVHSVPKFPVNATVGKYSYPETGAHYGQTFLCISLATKDIDVIGKLYLYNRPYFYDVNIPSHFDVPNLKRASNGDYIKTPPFSFVTSLTSLKGQSFRAFSKCAKFGKDLYEELVATTLTTSLNVETWRNGPGALFSNCSSTYKVYNVDIVSLGGQEFKSTKDHAKWAVSQQSALPWTCIGDINRERAQYHRGGGTVCFTQPEVHKSFVSSVANLQPC